MKKSIFLLLFLGSYVASFASKETYYISVDGNDAWSGTAAEYDGNYRGPFATLERARAEIRSIKSLKRLPKGGIEVIIGAGIYERGSTFELLSQDSGTAEAPIVYKSLKGTARIIGGQKLDPRWAQKVEDPSILRRLRDVARDNVLCVGLSDHSILGYGALQSRGFGQAMRPSALEFFFNSKAMQLSRIPNDGWFKILKPTTSLTAGQFCFNPDVDSKWINNDDIWVHGYWGWNWADTHQKVVSIEALRGIITTSLPYSNYGYKPGQRFSFLNILEELDSPGEWFLDRNSGKLLFWPPARVEKSELIVSTLEQPLIWLNGVSNVTIRGLSLEATRGIGVLVKNGENNQIAGCTIRNIGTIGISIVGGKNHKITSCELKDSGDSMIELSGGDRRTLTASGHVVTNNEITGFSRWDRTYRPAIHAQGVGTEISHNYIHDAPGVGIILNGNDHIIEYNTISNINWECNDVGAIYLGRDWTERGNIIRYNIFSKIKGYQDASSNGTADSLSYSIYLDDCASGSLVFGNIFSDVNAAVLIGGGRDNVIENNIVVNALEGFLIDARGLGWASALVQPPTGILYQRLLAVDYKATPYSTKYPGLVSILDNRPGAPIGNVIKRNIIRNSPLLHIRDRIFVESLLLVTENITDFDPHLNIAERNLNYLGSKEVSILNIAAIPIEKIGLIYDDYRKDLASNNPSH